MQSPQPLADSIPQAYVQLAEDGAQFLVAAAVVYAVGRLLVVPAVRWALGRAEVNPTLLSAVSSASHLGVVVFALAVGAGISGFTGALAGSTLVAAGLTVAVGLAAQDVLGNFVAGAFIVTDSDLNVGDTIVWDDRTGTIVDIDLRVTRVRTANNDRIVVPNTDLATSAVVNQTATDPVGIEHQFAVDPGADLDEVAGLVRNVARDLDHVAAKPRPSVEVTDLTAGSVVLTARIWLPIERKNRQPTVRSAFVRGVHDACLAEGIDLTAAPETELSGEVTIREPAD
ncbi:mechanosensitive ion channel family protein [Haloarcula litorea]|uniref:mechanosensitive ion channel family protein n=1 Tax=Haloarcula litorea TaxID=3032579 RepID=UPI0023E7DBEA|nr:mechanosensitive ion channel domain-containing protein [Halomicroarcula sp. GDY20]